MKKINLSPILPHYYDIFAEQTPEIHMWVTDYCHIMQNHEQILDFLRGAAFTPYQSG